MRYENYKAEITRAQRLTLVRVASAYWIVSTVALQVIASAVPVHLLVAERVPMYKAETNQKRETVRAEWLQGGTEWKQRLGRRS
ncbi:hypothetical protein JTB14_015561 [Gonioctena quinquepunctata]|nr:hypothetical protein JTB14_015561 [Gonioctena quinquepunctata]